MVQQQPNVSGKNRDFETFFGKGFFLLWKCSFDLGGTLLLTQTITQHENRDFDVSKENVFFDLATIQASKQTIYSCKTLLYEKENKKGFSSIRHTISEKGGGAFLTY